MEYKKQTAVEWLFRWFNDNQEATIQEGSKAFEHAKEMEKEQICSAVKYGCSDWGVAKDAENYCNEIYGR